MAQLNLVKREALPPPQRDAWRILVVDDEPEIHAVTRLALKGLQFDGGGIELLHADSAVAAERLLAVQDDIAIVLVDVVMESDDAGLRLVRHIRETLQNSMVRIILRTGQPGQAPEDQVIVQYDINDYKSKTELTAGKLFTAIVTALRAYGHLKQLDSYRRGLERVIETSDSLFEERSLQRFASGVLMQLASFVGVGANGILCLNRRDGPTEAHEQIHVLAASNPEWIAPRSDWSTLDLEPEVRALVDSTFDRKVSQFGPLHTSLYLGRGDQRAVVAYLHCAPQQNPMTRRLVELFCSKIAIGFSNVCLYERLSEANASLERKVHERTHELLEANEKLDRLASVDALTGAPNRRQFLQTLDRETARMRREGVAYSVLMIDIDHFKQVNDRHGHAGGDLVLRAVADEIARGLRQMDAFGRLGGEEFAALLPHTDRTGAALVAERLREAIAAHHVDVEGQVVRVTVSIGVGESAPEATSGSVLSIADNALYAAKNGGRNRVVCFGASLGG